MPNYTVRITKVYEEEYVDIEVNAKSGAAAMQIALDDAKANDCTLFNTPDFSYHAEIEE